MIVLVDLEHTISNASHRLYLLKEKPKDKFHKAFIGDSVNKNVKIFLHQLACCMSEVIILTAKNDKYESDVIKWLAENDIYYDDLIMKPNGFIGSATEFKESYVKNNYSKIDFALDDAGENCKMFFKYGIPSLRIEQR